MKKKKEALAVVVAAALLAALLHGAGWLLLPYADYNGTDWRRYAREPENSVDVLYVGSSLVFCDLDPVGIYGRCGVTGFNVAGPQQSMAISYYYIREACRTQSPRAVFVELGGMLNSPEDEFTVSDIAFMPRGMNRLMASLFAARPGDLPGLLFPALKYHDYWTSLDLASIREKLQPITPDPLTGYQPVTVTRPFEGIEQIDDCGSDYARNLRYLKKTADFCAEKGIELYLIYSPAGRTASPERKAQLRQELAACPVTDILDFTQDERLAAVGLDPETDWSDEMHLNVSGASKLSAWVADYLRARGFTASAAQDRALWQQRLDGHDAECGTA